MTSRVGRIGLLPAWGWKFNGGTNATEIQFGSGVTGRHPQPGDVGVVFVQVEDAITSPTAGWTQVASDSSAFDRSAVYAKMLDGSETAFSIGENTGINGLLFMCFDAGGWESPVADSDGVSVNTYTPATLTASAAGSVFINLVTISGNIALTDLTFTGAWDEVLRAASGVAINPAVGLVVARGGPGSSPALVWDPVGVNRDFRSGGIVITP